MKLHREEGKYIIFRSDKKNIDMYYYLFSVLYKTIDSVFTNGSVLSDRSSYVMKKGFCLVIGIFFF